MKELLREFYTIAEDLASAAADVSMKFDNALTELRDAIARATPKTEESKWVGLSELSPGERFSFCGVDWVKLEENGCETLCLAAECVTNKAFDEGNCNDWRGSTLREWLNAGAWRRKSEEKGFYTTLLEHEDMKGFTNPFCKIVSDLTADDGMKDYGTAEDYIALLSCDQYRKYRDIIPALEDEWYWTLTPWSCHAANSYNARVVSTSGALGYDYAYYGYGGVRPLCNLISEILVSPCRREGGEDE